MSWNNGYENAKFEARQKKLAAQYRKLGMTEEQIEAMREFDREQYRSNRRFYSHTQSFEACDFDEEDNAETLTTFQKFAHSLTVTIDDSVEKSRYWWIEEIDDPALVNIIKELSPENLELLTMYVFEGYTQEDLAAHFVNSQKTICKRIENIFNFFKNRV